MATTEENLKAFMEAGTRYYACPTGTMLPFAGTTVPTGFLLCNGAAVSRTTYAKLFAAIGTKWGAGDGSTTFNLPNCNDRCLEGTTSTSNVGTYLSAGLPNITGKFPYQIRNYVPTTFSGVFSSDKTKSGYWAPSSDSDSCYCVFSALNGSSIYKTTSTVQPPSFQALIIIKL